ncbi:MAG TPA: hypothetical protein VGZ71_14015 [Puia sp.]|jgi:hypothetical protein|nr:hypothetical protein [Puia sp.]
MKKQDIPQDLGPLSKITKEVCYAVDDSGRYTTELSQGWEVKTNALDAAWQDIKERVTAAREKVIKKEASPLLYFMELRLMDVPIVAAYTGFWNWQVRRHMKPEVFERLSDKKLRKYAETFEVSVEHLKTMESNEA